MSNPGEALGCSLSARDKITIHDDLNKIKVISSAEKVMVQVFQDAKSIYLLNIFKRAMPSMESIITRYQDSYKKLRKPNTQKN